MLFIGILVFVTLPSLAQRLPFRTYASDQGLAHSVVFSMARDHEGYLWLGTPDGISRFDGLRFESFGSLDGQSDIVARSLFVAPGGRVWVGTDSGAIWWDGDLWKTLTTLPSTSVRSFAKTRGEQIFAGTYAGLFEIVDPHGEGQDGTDRFDGDGPEKDAPRNRPMSATKGQAAPGQAPSGPYVRQVNALAGIPIRSLAPASTGGLWIGTWGNGVWQLGADGEARSWGAAQGLTDSFVRAILESRAGQLLVATNSGVFFIRDEVFTPLPGGLRLAGGPITALLEDYRGRLWLGTRDQGACRLPSILAEAETLRCYGSREGLAEDSITALLEDQEENLWLATFGGGISRLSTEAFRNFGARDGLPHANVRGLIQEPDGSIWLGTHGGGLMRVPREVDGAPSRDTAPGQTAPGQTAAGLTAIGESKPSRGAPSPIVAVSRSLGTKIVATGLDSEGKAWIGTLEGAGRLVPGSSTSPPRIAAEKRLAGMTVFGFYGSPSGSFFFATLDGILRRDPEGNWDRWGPQIGLPSPRINHILGDGKGGIWVATGKGLAHLEDSEAPPDPANTRAWGVSDGLPSGYVDHLLRRPDGSLWMATAGGLARLSTDGEIRVFGQEDGLSHDKCTALVEDSDGNLWIGTTRGIDVYDGAAFLSFGLEDGLVSAEVNPRAVLRTTEGQLWFGTVRGAVVFEGVPLGRRVFPPQVHLRALEVRDRPVGLAESVVRLGPNENRLRFEYTGISLAYPDSLIYELRLAGLESEWRTTRARSVEYPLVPPGAYTFQVRARARGGVPSTEPAALRLEIAAHVWDRPWFRLSALGLLGLLVLSIHRGRLMVVERRNRALESEVEKRRLAEAETQRYAEQLEIASFYDPLTNLPNRALFRERIRVALEQLQRHPERGFAVLALDLDRFQLINSVQGHRFGDRVLCVCAERLRGALADADTLARLSGDEFAVLLTELTGLGHAHHVAQNLLEELGKPLALDGEELRLGAALGIVLGNAVYEEPGQILRNLNSALDRARIQGRGKIAVYDPRMHARSMEILRLEGDLRRALDQEQFELRYQPILTALDRRLVSFEALVRWNHPTRGLLLPHEFLPQANEANLQAPLGSWILDRATSQVAAWASPTGETTAIAMSINLFHQQVTQRNLAEQLESLTSSLGLDPSCLHLEITEGVLIEEPDAAIEVLTAVKELGSQIYLDDFGTGYSSLSYLQRFPVDVLKIDRSFVQHMLDDDTSHRIVESILHLAQKLELRVVAEGVETQAQLDRLQDLGCDYIQGFLLGRPLTAEQASELVLADQRQAVKPGISIREA